MNKEEIENINRKLETTEDDTVTINLLYQKVEFLESILDKVTDFATKIVTENTEKYNSENQKEVDFSQWNLAQEILNIIEGEKK